MSLTPVVGKSRSAEELLAWGWQTTETALRDAVFGLPSAVRTVVGYHFGWWDRHGRPEQGGHGKALRPTLLLLTAQALGGRLDETTRTAAAVELVHNFSLVHDDVMDGDRTRHHRPTVWHAFGVNQAILAGDAMLALAFRLVAESAGPLAARASECLARCVVRLCEGQYGDLAFERRENVTLPECLAMVGGKTATLLECSCALGALLAGADTHRVDAVRGYGRALGVAFQVVDDMLGIWGDSAVTGKPVGADLARRKKSLPVVAALTSGTEAGQELATLYRGKGPLDPVGTERAAELIEVAGGRDWARKEIAACLAEATAHLDAAGCEPMAYTELLTLARLITNRDC